MNTATVEKDTARDQARAQFESIVEMVERLRDARLMESDEYDWEQAAKAVGFSQDDETGDWFKPGFHRDIPGETEMFSDAKDACIAADAGVYLTEDDAREAIESDALSVEVRSGWQSVSDDRLWSAEYRILLCTGGPAVQIVGNLSEYGEPETARIQYQDWFVPWKAYRGEEDERGALNMPCGLSHDEAEDVLLDYARCFYFGEG